jgi:predicted secreted protein
VVKSACPSGAFFWDLLRDETIDFVSMANVLGNVSLLRNVAMRAGHDDWEGAFKRGSVGMKNLLKKTQP